MAPLVKPKDLDFTEKKFAMLIAGYPGIGKTTLALSAPNPLLADIEKGIDRVEPKHRKDSLQVDTYEELLNDLDEEKVLDDYDTFVIDTGGELVELMKPYVIKQNPQNGQRDGSLTLKGYGAVGREFQRFVRKIKGMQKNIIVVFHTKEEKEDDKTKLRIAVEGQTKENIWKSIDIGGFMEMQGKNRTIGFSNSERYFAKGIHGVSGIYQIPNLEKEKKNTFVSDLFHDMRESIIKSKKEHEEGDKKYMKAMKFKDTIGKATTPDDLMDALDMIEKKVEHALTSKRELKHHLNEKAKSIGCEYDRKQKTFVKKEG